MVDGVLTTIYAVKQRDGWVIVVSLRDNEHELRADLDELGLMQGETRRIDTRLVRQRPSAGTTIISKDNPDIDYVAPAIADWFFDPLNRCWLAPEAGAQFGRQATNKQPHVQVEFGCEDTGWLEFEVNAGRQRLEFSFSAVDDAFKPLVLWLEKLLDGTSRVILAAEGSLLECHTFPAPDDHIRLTIYADYWKRNESTYASLDVILPRLAIVRGFYKAILEYWHRESVPGDWLDGRQGPRPADYNPDKYLYYFYPLRSSRIEAALGVTETDSIT